MAKFVSHNVLHQVAGCFFSINLKYMAIMLRTNEHCMCKNYNECYYLSVVVLVTLDVLEDMHVDKLNGCESD